MQHERTAPQRPPPPSNAAPMSSSQNSVIHEIQTRIRRFHDESYLYIEQGLSCDELGHTDQAVTLYNKGLVLIDKGFKVVRSYGKMIGPEWKNTNKLVEKMKKTKVQIETRVKTLIESDPIVQKSLNDPPPDYEASLHESMLEDNSNAASNSQTANASELFKIQEGVQIFFINESGGVSAPSYPSELGIYKFTETAAASHPPAFLQVGSWNYPLLPGKSPALHSIWGAYVFPDTTTPGSSIGVILPDSVSHSERNKFESLLGDLTKLKTQSASDLEGFTFPEVPEDEPTETQAENRSSQLAEEDDRTSSKVAKGLVTAAEWISWGLTKGAEKTGVLMKKSSSFIQEKVNPQDEPSKIDPRAQQGVHYARQATGAVVKVSGYIVTKLGEGTVALARIAAPHVRAQGEKLLPTSLTSKDGSGHSKMGDVTVVAVGGLHGWATVYTGLESAAKALATSLTTETVNVVKHKYGSEAGQLTENSMFAAGNVGMAAYNFNNLGIKAIAKRAAKDTGKAVVEDYNKKSKADKEDSTSAYNHTGLTEKGKMNMREQSGQKSVDKKKPDKEMG